MTSLVHPLHSLAYRASKLAHSLTPFFFVQNHSENALLKTPQLTIKINREMSPLLNKLPEHVRLGLWNTQPLSQSLIQPQKISNSFLMNPFKTERIVNEALRKGVSKMLVSDIEELTKIQEAYFRLRKQGLKIKEPQFIWSVENLECDTENISMLLKCDLPLSGLCFSKEMDMHQIKRFMSNKKVSLGSYLKLREISVQKFSREIIDLENLGIQPLVTNYSEIGNYSMVCRVIGNDKSGNPILDQSCLDFICRNQSCSCQAPPLKHSNRFSAGGFDWIVIQPKRLDRLRRQFIVDI